MECDAMHQSPVLLGVRVSQGQGLSYRDGYCLKSGCQFGDSILFLTQFMSEADPPENCLLIVKKIAKNLTTKLPKISFFFKKIANGIFI